MSVISFICDLCTYDDIIFCDFYCDLFTRCGTFLWFLLIWWEPKGAIYPFFPMTFMLIILISLSVLYSFMYIGLSFSSVVLFSFFCVCVFKWKCLCFLIFYIFFPLFCYFHIYSCVIDFIFSSWFFVILCLFQAYRSTFLCMSIVFCVEMVQ